VKTDPKLIEQAKRLRAGGLTYPEIAEIQGGSPARAWLRVNRK
jgi:hypothetical protein